MTSLNSISELEINRMLNNIPIFAGIGRHEQHLLASKWSIEDRNTNEIVIKEGDIGNKFYLILKGSVIISKQTRLNKSVKINILHAGDVFGEIAILRSIPRTANVTTLTPCTFLTIDAKNFLKIYQYFSAQSRNNIQLVIEKRLHQLKREY